MNWMIRHLRRIPQLFHPADPAGSEAPAPGGPVPPGLRLKSYFAASVPAAVRLARQELGGHALLVAAREAGRATGAAGGFEVVFAVTPARGMAPPGEPEARPAARRGEPAGRSQANPGATGAGQGVAAFVGPPGSGKTTLVLRIAAEAQRSRGARVRIVTFDTRRVGRIELLRRHGAVLGIEVAGVLTGRDAERLLAAGDGLTLIDTPGFAGGEEDKLDRLGRCLRRESALEIHLVVPAVTGPDTRRRIRERFARLRPDRLAFTHLDEPEAWHAVAADARETGLPVSFASAGQRLGSGWQWRGAGEPAAQPVPMLDPVEIEE